MKVQGKEVTCPVCGAVIQIGADGIAGEVTHSDAARMTASNGAPADIAELASACRSILKLDEVQLAPEYYYQSLPLCVIDSVFSLNIRYTLVRKIVDRACAYLGLKKLRPYGTPYPPPEDQESISRFIARVSRVSPEELARGVFQSTHRTSTRSGILKAEAAVRFCQVLQTHGVDYFQDMPKVAENEEFAAGIQAIPGQKSGLTLGYFFMLAGEANMAKPDRHVLAFWQGLLGRKPSVQEARGIMAEVAKELQPAFPGLAVRTLDYAVWNYQRALAGRRVREIPQ